MKEERAMPNAWVRRARRRLFGEPVVHQPVAEVERRLRLGEQQTAARDQEWPHAATDMSEVARDAVEATRETGLP